MAPRDFWTTDAEAMELTIDGTRLIVSDVCRVLSAMWWSLRLRSRRDGPGRVVR